MNLKKIDFYIKCYYFFVVVVGKIWRSNTLVNDLNEHLVNKIHLKNFLFFFNERKEKFRDVQKELDSFCTAEPVQARRQFDKIVCKTLSLFI